jgi:hypothetical protein
MLIVILERVDCLTRALQGGGLISAPPQVFRRSRENGGA